MTSHWYQVGFKIQIRNNLFKNLDQLFELKKKFSPQKFFELKKIFIILCYT